MATTSDTIVFARDDLDLIVAFAGCSLDEKPGSNWVQENGGLPEYICRIAKAVRKTGKTTSQAIAIAVSRVKKWAAGGDDVDADTRAKAAKALAEWEKLKGKSKAKSARKNDHALAASAQGEILCLSKSVKAFNVDSVRQAWQTHNDAARKKWWAENPNGSYSDGPGYPYIREMWSTFVISERANELFKVGYEVDADGNVTFDEPQKVKTQYVAVPADDMVGESVSDTQLKALMATVSPCHSSATDQVLLSIGTRPSALEMVLAARPSLKE